MSTATIKIKCGKTEVEITGQDLVSAITLTDTIKTIAEAALEAECMRSSWEGMNLFQEISARNLPCELCGEPTLALYGNNWDYDRIMCSDVGECGAEIVFATTTEVEE